MWPPGSWRIWGPTAWTKCTGYIGSGTNAQPCASVQPCKGTTPGTSLDPRATRGMPRTTDDHGPKRSWSLPGSRHAVTPQDATGGHYPGWVPPVARTEAPPPTVCPAEGPRQSSEPQSCRAAHRNSTRRGGSLAAPGAAAARCPSQHGESSSTRIWTAALEVPTTALPNGHHLPPIQDAGPRGPAPNGRTFPPFRRQASESDGQRFTRTPTRQQTEHPASPPSQGRQPARCRGDSSPRTHGPGDPRPTNGLHMGWGDNPPNAPPQEQGAVIPVPDIGTSHPTNWACTPRGSPAQSQHSQTAGARRTHRESGSTTRAAQEGTKK